jgi:hypothetical protein
MDGIQEFLKSTQDVTWDVYFQHGSQLLECLDGLELSKSKSMLSFIAVLPNQ